MECCPHARMVTESGLLAFDVQLLCSLPGKMSKGRPSGGSGTGGGMHVAAPRFVRVKKRAMVAEEACGKKGEPAKVGDKRAAVAFVRKSTAVLLEEAGGSQDKDSSLISPSKTDAHTTAGGKRHLPASQQGEGGALEGKVAKRMKLEEDMPVRNSCKGRRKRRKRGQKVVAAPAKKDHLEEALSYLRAWHNQRETWSFKKKMQVCLLEHMYDSSKVTHTRAFSQGMNMHPHTHTPHTYIYSCTPVLCCFCSGWQAVLCNPSQVPGRPTGEGQSSGGAEGQADCGGL